MSEYSMPSYFQTMPVIGKELVSFHEDNAAEIQAVEQEIHEKYQELGKVLYEANEAGEELPDESDVFEVIREKKEEVDELRAQIKIIKGVEICPFCGKEIVKNAAFCPHCGEKID